MRALQNPCFFRRNSVVAHLEARRRLDDGLEARKIFFRHRLGGGASASSVILAVDGRGREFLSHRRRRRKKRLGHAERRNEHDQASRHRRLLALKRICLYKNNLKEYVEFSGEVRRDKIWRETRVDKPAQTLVWLYRDGSLAKEAYHSLGSHGAGDVLPYLGRSLLKRRCGLDRSINYE
jgi:hypothetical protein